MIPKIIHQIWIGKNKRPDIWMDSWKEELKKRDDWEYKLWDENEIEKLEMYNRDIYEYETDYACKADILRYEILKTYGGIYVDADVVLLNTTFFDLFNDNKNELTFGLEPNQKLISNSIIASTPNNNMIKHIIIECRKNYIQNRKKGYPYQITGPSLITNLYHQYKLPFTILPSILFYPIYWKNINDPQYHKKFNYPYSYTFQYGYTTNNLSNKII
jgi:mannosyltransferase OCH1-like enzyme